jgi:hypothetical protein
MLLDVCVAWFMSHSVFVEIGTILHRVMRVKEKGISSYRHP